MSKLFLKISKYYWTFIGSLIERKNRPSSASKNILIFKTDGLGDFFLLVPFIQNILSNGYSIVCIGDSSFNQIVTHLRLRITFIPLTNSNCSEFTALLSKVKQFNFDYAFNFSMNIWGGIIVNQSCSRLKIGLLQEREHYVYKGANLFYDKILSYPQAQHTFDVTLQVFKDTMNIGPAQQSIDTAIKDNGYIAIHPYATWQPRCWPYFQTLIEYLLDKNYTVHILGTTKEHSLNNWITSIKSDRCTVITLLSIDDLMTEIDNSTAFIGNDSGPAHYASLIGKPSTVIWGPGFFERIHPVGKHVAFCKNEIECRPCRQRGETCLRGESICLNKISVDTVIKTFEALLKIK